MIEGWQSRIDAAQQITHAEDGHGKRYRRIPHDGGGPCWDCATPPGCLHVPGCLREICAYCRAGQAALCSGCDLPD